MIAAGRDGLLYSDAAGFEKAIRDLYDDPPLRAALSRPDPRRFSAEHEARMLERILEEVVAGRNASLARQRSALTGSG